MATGDDIQWWCRTDGDDTNGGGFDSGIASAGTNYCDQAVAQLSLTDLATSGAGVTTITSATGGFTSAMIGNAIRIASGTNFTAGYYWITGYTDTNTITVSVSPTPSAAGSAGNGKIGGAFLGIKNLMSNASGGLSNPTITSPLAAGHRINLGGTGGDDPGTGGGVAPTGMDYDYRGTGPSYGGYYSPAWGSSTAGRIKLVGYKQGGGLGRPCIAMSGGLFNNTIWWHFENLKFIFTHIGGNSTFGIGGSSIPNYHTFVNIIVDMNGRDFYGIRASQAYYCEVKNTGGTTAGTGAAILSQGYGSTIYGCVVKDVCGNGFAEASNTTSAFINCIADSCKASGFNLQSAQYSCCIINCTAYNCTNDGIRLNTNPITMTMVINCTLHSNGGYAINCQNGTQVVNDKRRSIWLTNNAYNSSTLYNAVTAPSDHLNVDSQFTDAANGNFAVGSNLKANGKPSVFRSGNVTSYVDIGAVQRQEPNRQTTNTYGSPLINTYNY